ncbi:MAG: hypothetical protein ABI234_18910 [Ktedonobacteraceae bacterium]
MHTRQWKATWTDQDGNPQQHTFNAPENRILAEIDFQFTRIEQGKPVPEQFTLEKGRQVMRVVPSLRELEKHI